MKILIIVQNLSLRILLKVIFCKFLKSKLYFQYFGITRVQYHSFITNNEISDKIFTFKDDLFYFDMHSERIKNLSAVVTRH